jgi:predicted pyridoxine 5'-phosphate oxidase superfamily flavin-nucleotide-binding protein
LSKIVGKVTRALEQPYAELLALLPSVAVAQVDETGHKNNGELRPVNASLTFFRQRIVDLWARQNRQRIVDL